MTDDEAAIHEVAGMVAELIERINAVEFRLASLCGQMEGILAALDLEYDEAQDMH